MARGTDIKMNDRHQPGWGVNHLEAECISELSDKRAKRRYRHVLQQAMASASCAASVNGKRPFPNRPSAIVDAQDVNQ